MTYAVELGPVRKDLRALDDKTRRRVLRALVALEVNPRPPGAKKLRGESELWRVRVGDYRILYGVEEHSWWCSSSRSAIAGRSIAATVAPRSGAAAAPVPQI